MEYCATSHIVIAGQPEQLTPPSAAGGRPWRLKDTHATTGNSSNVIMTFAVVVWEREIADDQPVPGPQWVKR